MTTHRETPRESRARRLWLLLALTLTTAVLLLGGAPPAHGGAPGVEPSAGAARIPTSETWRWPVTPVRILKHFVAPAHEYGPGHRGVDLAASGSVMAPASGVVAFSGTVVDRPLITIDHGDGLVTTLEPVASELSPGDAVARGDDVGTVASGGSAPPGAVHFGVRWHGEYVNPLLLLGGVPRAILLPCCA